MSIDLLESADVTVTLVPDVLPASATLSFRTPGNTIVEAPTVTVNSVDTTVASVTAQDVLVLTSVTGVLAGHAYWWGSVNGGLGGVVRVSEVVTSTKTVTLEEPVPGIARASDVFKGVECTADITGTGVTPRGLFWQLRWRVTDAAGTTYDYTESAHVVRQRFAAPVSPSEASRYVTALYPTAGTDIPTPGRWAALARRASDRVRRKATASSRYVHLVGDHDVWADAGLCALRIELAMEGLVPPGYDAASYQEGQEEYLGRLIDEAIAGSWYDRDDDGTVNEVKELPRFGSVMLVRR